MVKISSALLLLCIFITSCKKEKEVDCANTTINFSITTTASDPCIANGTLQVTSVDVLSYKINNNPFQSTGNFTNLLPANYLLTIQNSLGCTKTDSIVIATKNIGFLFSEVKVILATRCNSCHSGLNPQAGLDWTDNCTIVNNKDRIRARAIDGNSATMPPAGLIPLQERNKIMEWINAGGKYTD